MENPLRSDSPACRRIILAFLEFLNSVELAPGVDSEAIEVARDCLVNTFNLNSPSMEEMPRPGFLMDLFMSAYGGEQHKLRSDPCSKSTASTSKATIASAGSEVSEPMNTSKMEASGEDSLGEGLEMDDLFGKFYIALEKSNFFKSSHNGIEDPDQIDKATRFFNDAIEDMKNSDMDINLMNLAEILKSKGNEALRRKQYSEAIDIYTCAISICEKAIYFCNRAAAYTQIHKYNDAIQDCLKSIEIDPNYTKAYSRLGSAYFAQGNYCDALDKGYLKALQLDPNNTTIWENIQVTRQKLAEQHLHDESNQNGRSSHNQESNTQSARSTSNSFQSVSMDASPADFMSNIFRMMTSGTGQGSVSQSAANSGSPFGAFPINVSMPNEFGNVIGNLASAVQGQRDQQTTPSSEPELGADLNVNLNIGEGTEHVSAMLRSVVGMFSPQGGAAPGANQTNGRDQ